MNDERTRVSSSSSSLEDFNWILPPLSKRFNTGLFSIYQPLSAQLLHGV